jgi:hypothetical protein
MERHNNLSWVRMLLNTEVLLKLPDGFVAQFSKERVINTPMRVP